MKHRETLVKQSALHVISPLKSMGTHTQTHSNKHKHKQTPHPYHFTNHKSQSLFWMVDIFNNPFRSK